MSKNTQRETVVIKTCWHGYRSGLMFYVRQDMI